MIRDTTFGHRAALFAAVFWVGSIAGGAQTAAAEADAQAPARDQQAPVAPLQRPVTVQLDQATLVEALREIARQATVGVSYDATVSASSARVTIRAVNRPAIAVIRDAAKQAGFEAVAGSDGESVRIAAPTSGEGDAAQAASILGVVTDAETGAVVTGAEVLLEGTRWRTTSGEDGRYRLHDVAPGAYTVVARRIGYLPETRSVTIDDQEEASVDVVLQPAATMLGELVVTAQKHGEERLRDVPIPVTSLNADKLAEQSQVLIRDYYSTVPSLSLVANYGFFQNLAIRGITTGGFSNPTVGIMVDDVPYGVSINNGGGNQVPDIDPGDLARVEVLRGPQGTLYGTNSMGGLVNYVTKDPSTVGFNGRVEAGIHSVHNGAEPGYNLRASANIPLGRALAMRVSGFTRQDPGYIDNPVQEREGLNDAQSAGARVSTLWQPTDAFSVKVSALYQRTDLNGVSEVHVLPGLGDLEQNYALGIAGSEREVHAYSAILRADLGFADLTSLTGYNVNQYANAFDRSVALGEAAMRDFGVAGLAGFDANRIKKFTQEIRLSAAIGQRFEWVAGAFVTDESARIQQNFMAADPATGRIVGLEWYRDNPLSLREYAAFANLTYHVTDRFDIQIGARESQIRENDDEYTQRGPYTGETAPVIAPPLKSKANAFTYLVTPRFKLSPDVMVYGRLASGYRPGGPNFAAAGAPSQYEPDKTQNYEVGIKGDFLDHRLTVDASIYYIDWKDLQIQLRTPELLTYQANGSRARSRGVELTVASTPFTGLTATGWIAYNDAELTEPFPENGTAYGVPGDRLPNSTRFSGHVSVEQSVPLGSRAAGFVGGVVTYTGERTGVFTDSPLREVFPSYTKTDLRAGVRRESWTARLFVDNVTDERGLIGGGISYQPSYAYVIIRPRTIGLSVSRSF